MKYTEELQKYLPFGYLFLVVMGIIEDSVRYYQLGINILHYSSIMDILISPIATLMSHPIVVITVGLMVLSIPYYANFLRKNIDKQWAQKHVKLKNRDALSEQEIDDFFKKFIVQMSASVLLSIFLGYGLADGHTLSQEIKEDKLTYKHKLNYSSGESEVICLINTNSLYYFYVAKGNKAIKIAPIGAIKSIEFTNNKMLK